MIPPSRLMAAIFGFALATVHMAGSDGHNSDDSVDVDQVIPHEYKLRKALLPVIEEFENMYDSVFMPKTYERPYDQNVLELLFSMRRFLYQSPELEKWLKESELENVLYFSYVLRKPATLSDEDIKAMLDWMNTKFSHPYVNARKRKLSDSLDEQSPLYSYLSALAKGEHHYSSRSDHPDDQNRY